jgi:hypothetical protein
MHAIETLHARLVHRATEGTLLSGSAFFPATNEYTMRAKTFCPYYFEWHHTHSRPFNMAVHHSEIARRAFLHAEEIINC